MLSASSDMYATFFPAFLNSYAVVIVYVIFPERARWTEKLRGMTLPSWGPQCQTRNTVSYIYPQIHIHCSCNRWLVADSGRLPIIVHHIYEQDDNCSHLSMSSLDKHSKYLHYLATVSCIEWLLSQSWQLALRSGRSRGWEASNIPSEHTGQQRFVLRFTHGSRVRMLYWAY